MQPQGQTQVQPHHLGAAAHTPPARATTPCVPPCEQRLSHAHPCMTPRMRRAWQVQLDRYLADRRRNCGDPSRHFIPFDLAQLKENLSGLEQGPMVGDEMDNMRAFGRAVRG